MSPVKREIRTLGVDDGPFQWGDAHAPVVAVAMRGAGYVEGVLHTRVAVDGSDATARLGALIGGSRFRAGLKAILLDGIALAGFNVVDPAALHQATGVPVVTVTRGAPDRGALEAALREHVADWEARLAVMDKHWPTPVDAPGGTLSVGATGLPLDAAVEVLERATARGAIPEPIRLAHLIASALVKGESTGPA